MARAQQVSGLFKRKSTLRKFYAFDTKKVSVDLPSSIETLLNRKIINCSLEETINQHTLWPFYRPFLSKYQVSQISEKMIKGDGSSIHFTSGIMASVVKMDHCLRLCPLCMQNDIHKYGESYWHTQHQLPGVLVCPLHQCILLSHCQICNQSLSIDSDGAQGFPLHPTFCKNGHDLSEQVEKVIDVKLLSLAKEVTTLFELCKDSRIPLNLKELYVKRLKQMGLCTINNSIKQKELISRFLTSFSEEFLIQIGVPQPRGDFSWLSTMLRKDDRSFHPLLHTLLILFLWGNVEGILAPITDKPFGNGPWPCLNKTAAHYKERIIQEVKIKRSKESGNPVGDFRCEECGFQYSRTGPDRENEKEIFSYGRVRDFGNEWRERVDALLAEGGSIRSIAAAAGVDSRTIVLYISKRNILTKKINTNDYKEKSLRRNRFLTSIHASDGGPISVIRKSNPKDYAWLYRWDRDWLRCALPTKRNGVKHSQRVDWDLRDKEIALMINDALLQLKKKTDRPTQITVSKIGKLIGKKAILEKHIKKLTLCQALLKMNVETIEMYQMRKIEGAVYKIQKSGKPLRKWRVLKEAGIRIIRSSVVEEYLNKKLAEAAIYLSRAV